MAPPYPLRVLVARGKEQLRIDALLDGAREGMSAALVLVGEPGIGKTALLEHAAVGAAGFRILRARGVQSEAELAFAALLELCRPILGQLERLEPRQAEALGATFGFSEEQGATPFAIGAATLSLLAAAAEEGPLLLLVDDAHWLDPASADALAFAVRRFHVDAVAALFAMRPGEGRSFSGRQLPELVLERLDASSAATLLASRREELDPAERARILDLAQGNPLALLELPRVAAVADLQEEPVWVGKQLEQAFRARAETLPEPSCRALVVAAAASTSELGILAYGARAARALTCDSRARRSGGSPLTRRRCSHLPTPTRPLRPLSRGRPGRAAPRPRCARRSPRGRRSRRLAPCCRCCRDPTFGRRPLSNAPPRRRPAAPDSRRRRPRTSGRHVCPSGREDRLRRLSAAADSAWLAGRTAHALALIEEALAHAADDARRGELLYLRGTIQHFGGDPARAAATLEEAGLSSRTRTVTSRACR